MTGLNLQFVIGHPLGMAMPALATVVITPAGASTTNVTIIGAGQPPGPVSPPVIS